METLARSDHLLPSSSARRDLFTDTEVAAAEQLVQLSGSSGDADPDAVPSTSAASASSSPRSVNARPPAPPPPEALLLEAEDEEEEVGPRRRKKRYRSIAEIYASTDPVAVRRGGDKRGRTKR
ncbi:hypothetical protein Cni_G03379 [Canna indica]|uniref:Uncharacterized protein n=1 Tax=Canna indica TaxID=4628 RepID=A0AAQ3Q3B4_9LILI|nr:hypothetical protein Cni_G03379 [Canna indica]